MSANEERRRRYWSYSTRTLLVFVALIAVGLAWVAWLVRDGQRQAAAVRMITSRPSGRVYYAHDPNVSGLRVGEMELPGHPWLRKTLGDHCFYRVEEVCGRLDEESLGVLREFDYLEEVQVYGEGITDGALENLQPLSTLRKLTIADAPVTDRGIALIGELQHLERLWLSNVAITDRGLRWLDGLGNLRDLSVSDLEHGKAGNIRGNGLGDFPNLPSLENLRLEKVPIEDEALQYIVRYKRLRRLDLSHTKIRGPGIPYLVGLPDLRSVILTGCPVSDEAVVYLKRLKQVRFLGLSETGLSQQAFDELSEALPDCTISGGDPGGARVRRYHGVTAKCLDENGDSQETELYVAVTDDLMTAIMVLDRPGMPAVILGDTERLQLLEALKKSHEWAKTARENAIQPQVQDLLDLRREDTTGTGKRGLALRLVYSATGPQEERCRVFLDFSSVVDGATATVICEPEHVKDLMSALDEISEALDALREGKPVSY